MCFDSDRFGCRIDTVSKKPHVNLFSSLGIQPSLHPMPKDAVEHAQAVYDQSILVVSIGSLYMQGNVLTSLGVDTNEDLSFVAKH